MAINQPTAIQTIIGGKVDTHFFSERSQLAAYLQQSYDTYKSMDFAYSKVNNAITKRVAGAGTVSQFTTERYNSKDRLISMEDVVVYSGFNAGDPTQRTSWHNLYTMTTVRDRKDDGTCCKEPANPVFGGKVKQADVDQIKARFAVHEKSRSAAIASGDNTVAFIEVCT
jgi:hypothetical protein